MRLEVLGLDGSVDSSSLEIRGLRVVIVKSCCEARADVEIEIET